MTESTPGNHEHPPLYIRNIAVLDFEGCPEVSVDHVFAPGTEPCTDCGSPAVAPGLIGLTIGNVQILMTPAGAELLRNRLGRAVNLVLEAQEDPPDPVREAARFGAVPDSPESLA